MIKNNTLLKPLFEFIEILNFQDIDTCIYNTDPRDEEGFHIIKKTKCNNLLILDFQNYLKEISDNILFEANENLKENPKEYIKKINQAISDLNVAIPFLSSSYNNEINIRKLESISFSINEYGDCLSSNELLTDKNEFILFVIKTGNQLIESLNMLLPNQKQSEIIEKMKWNVKPSVLAALLNELINKGWIDCPLFNTDNSPKRLAELCEKIFEFEGTTSSLKRSIQENNLAESKKLQIVLPDIKNFK